MNKSKTEVRIECTEKQLRRMMEQVEFKSMDTYANMHSQRAYVKGADDFIEMVCRKYGRVCEKG